MKKTKTERKRLSIDLATVRRLESDLTADQLKAAVGGIVPETNACTGSSKKGEYC